MESLYLTLRELAAYACTSTRIIQRLLKAGELTRYGSGPLILDEELEAGGFSIGSSGARAMHHGKP